MSWFNIIKSGLSPSHRRFGRGGGITSQFLTEIFNIPLKDIRALHAKGLKRELIDAIQFDYVRDITEEDFNYIMEFMERGEYEKGIDELIKVTQPIKDNRNRERRMMANRKRRDNQTDEEREEYNRKERERYANRTDEENKL
mgnify:CR=1 FL=1